MTVFEYMIIEAFTGVEREIVKLKVSNLKSELDLIPICNSSIRKAFLVVYKLYPKIETLEEEEKKELWEFVRKHFPGKRKDELIENCKIIYTAGKIV